MKDDAEVLKLHITFLFDHMSISENTVPNEMKSARVEPLFKKNNKLDPSYPRSASIWNNVSKILERPSNLTLQILVL